MFQVVTRALLICLISGNGIANSVPESCDGLDAIASSPSLQCQRSNDCLYLDCNITLFSGYGAKVELLPCDQPPAIEIFLKTPSGESKLGKFDSSQPPSTRAIPLDGGAEFQFIVSWISIQTVTITGRLVNSGTGEVFQTIVEPTNVTLPPCTPNDEPATTCEALRHIANHTDLECDTSEGDDCDTMKCDTVLNSFPITTTYMVLPCNDPPAIRVVVEAAGTTVVDKVVSESQEISVVANLVTANVTLDQLDTSIGFQVYVVTRDWDGYIFEYTKIPIDKTQCKDDEPATTCEALRHIANNTDLECDTSEGDDCDTMKCDTVLNSFPITTTYIVLPCNDPPAIRVVVEAAGTTVVDKVVSESQEISVVANLVTANVTLDQLDTSIGFQVYVVTRDWDGYIFEYTKIPIDKTQCKATDGESGASNVHMMSALLLLPTLSTLSYLLS